MHAPPTVPLVAKPRGTGEPLEVEARLRRADGEKPWHLLRAQPYRDSNVVPTGWVGTNTEIHDVKLAELERVSRRRVGGSEYSWVAPTDALVRRTLGIPALDQLVTVYE